MPVDWQNIEYQNFPEEEDYMFCGMEDAVSDQTTGFRTN
jgi:hypothetical protein